jgi:hypothetical protein
VDFEKWPMGGSILRFLQKMALSPKVWALQALHGSKSLRDYQDI